MDWAGSGSHHGEMIDEGPTVGCVEDLGSCQLGCGARCCQRVRLHCSSASGNLDQGRFCTIRSSNTACEFSA